MTTDPTITPCTLRDEFAMRAPVEMLMVHALWGEGEVNFADSTTRRAFLAIWAMLCYEWADAMMEQRLEPPPAPGTPTAPAEDRRLDRLLVTLDWFDFRIIVPLKKAGVETLRELLALDVLQLDAIKGIGEGSLPLIIDRLNREGLLLKPKADAPPAGGSQAVGAQAVGT